MITTISIRSNEKLFLCLFCHNIRPFQETAERVTLPFLCLFNLLLPIESKNIIKCCIPFARMSRHHNVIIANSENSAKFDPKSEKFPSYSKLHQKLIFNKMSVITHTLAPEYVLLFCPHQQEDDRFLQDPGQPLILRHLRTVKGAVLSCTAPFLYLWFAGPAGNIALSYELLSGAEILPAVFLAHILHTLAVGQMKSH